MEEYFLDSTTGDWTAHARSAGALVRALITAEHDTGLTVSRVRLLPGAEISLHDHPHSTETVFVLAGTVACRIGDVENEMTPGHVSWAPPGVVHSIRNDGSDPVEALTIFSPPL